MGKLKNKLKDNTEGKKYEIAEEERAFLMSLQTLSNAVELAVNQLSGQYLSHVARRLGYTSGKSLKFDIDPADKDSKLVITELSD